MSDTTTSTATPRVQPAASRKVPDALSNATIGTVLQNPLGTAASILRTDGPTSQDALNRTTVAREVVGGLLGGAAAKVSTNNVFRSYLNFRAGARPLVDLSLATARNGMAGSAVACATLYGVMPIAEAKLRAHLPDGASKHLSPALAGVASGLVTHPSTVALALRDPSRDLNPTLQARIPFSGQRVGLPNASALWDLARHRPRALGAGLGNRIVHSAIEGGVFIGLQRYLNARAPDSMKPYVPFATAAGALASTCIPYSLYLDQVQAAGRGVHRTMWESAKHAGVRSVLRAAPVPVTIGIVARGIAQHVKQATTPSEA